MPNRSETAGQRQLLAAQLRQIERQLAQVDTVFNLAVEDGLIDYCILQRKALLAHYSHCLAQLRAGEQPAGTGVGTGA